MAKKETKLGEFLKNPPLECNGLTISEMIEFNVTASYMYLTMVGRACSKSELQRLDSQNFRLESATLPDWSHLFANNSSVYREAIWRLLFAEKYINPCQSVGDKYFQRRRLFMDEAIKRVAYVWGYEKTARAQSWALEMVLLRPKLNYKNGHDFVSRVVVFLPSIVNVKNTIKTLQKQNLIMEANAKSVASKTHIRLIQSTEWTAAAWRQAVAISPNSAVAKGDVREAFTT